jgi:hypothetical protein
MLRQLQIMIHGGGFPCPGVRASLRRNGFEKWPETADIITLAQRVERINGVGRRWYAGIKALDDARALRMVAWLRDVADAHQDSIELQLGRHVAMARSTLYSRELDAVVAPATDIRPWKSSSCR